MDAARRHGEKGRGPAAVNSAYDRVVAPMMTLRTAPDRGRGFLVTCLANSDPSVVMWAASYLLPQRRAIKALKLAADGLVTLVAWTGSHLLPENQAIKALRRVARWDTGLVGLDAEMTLREWRAGRLEFGYAQITLNELLARTDV